MWMRTSTLVSLLAAVSLAACGSHPPAVADAGTGGGSAGGDGEVGGGSGGGGGGGGGAGGGGGGADVLAPTLRSTSPASGATSQALDVPFVVAFSEPMSPASVTVSIYPVVALGAPAFDAENTSLTVVPSAELSPNTLYTVTIDGADLAGNRLAGLRAFSFTTRVVDVIGPRVEATVPLKDAMSVSVSSTIAITFSEPMDLATVGLELSPVVGLGTSGWSQENRTVTFAPPGGLEPATHYTVTLSGRDLAGNDLAGPASFSFTTGLAPDTTPPTVIDTTPGNGEVGVSNSTLIIVNFSGPMRLAETEAALVLESVGGMGTLGNCTSRWLWNAQRTLVSCQPNPVLAFSAPHRVTVGVGAQDDAGHPLAAPFVFTFTTGAAPDTTPPTVFSVSPGLGSIGAERNAFVQVTFSEAMDPTATQGAFTCVVGATPLGGSFTWYTRNRVLRFTPAATFVSGVTVSCAVRGGSLGARDVAGNRLEAHYPWTFRVLRAGSVIAPPVADLDGSVDNTGSASPTLSTAYVGDTSTNLSVRSFFDFTLAGLPDEAHQVTGATLYLYFIGPVGAPSSLGSLDLEHLDYGPSLTSSDYGLTALSSSPWSVAFAAGFHPVSVTSSVQNDFANRVSRGNRVQFRLRFNTEVTVDGASDGLLLSTTEWGTASQRPYLVVSFEYP